MLTTIGKFTFIFEGWIGHKHSRIHILPLIDFYYCPAWKGYNDQATLKLGFGFLKLFASLEIFLGQ